MKILFLYENPKALRLSDWLITEGNEIAFFSDPIEPNQITIGNFDLVVSYTYRHILPKTIIEEAHGNIINLHIAYLPWNRGASPNQYAI